VVVLDIGLGEFANLDDGAPRLVDERWVAERIPPISASAHKGTRKKLAICGGARGMAGAAILAARAALRSSVGMVRLVVDDAGLARALGAPPRAALLTPHPAEFARLIAATPGVTVETVLADRFEIGSMVTQVTGAAVLLKGVPTVIFASGGPPLVSASGNPVLAAAGSGDVLSGIAGTLLAQIGNPLEAGAAAAWIHGRAAERAVVARQPFDSRGHQPD